MRGYSKTIIVGNLGSDPDKRTTPKGNVVTLSVATNETWKDKESGEKKERTEWHRVKCFGGLADVADSYLQKGSAVLIEGRNRTDKYTDKEGVERYSTEIIAKEIRLLGGTKGDDAPSSASDSDE